MMSLRTTYHSALFPPPPSFAACELHEGRCGIAFVWDAAEGLPPEMLRRADVLYAEPPWRFGYDEFARRAGRPNRMVWKDLMELFGVEVRRSGLPAVVICGKVARDRLRPDAAVPAWLNGQACLACLWKLEIAPGLDATAILSDLAQRFETVGDPFCGYGRSARVFAAAGKSYVSTDFSTECIGRISRMEDI